MSSLPIRFMEWSTAVLEMQLDELNNPSHSGACMHYLGIFLEDDATLQRHCEGFVASKLMQNWWDISEQAGDQRRPRNPFSEPLPSLEVLTIGDNKCKNLRYDSIFIFFPSKVNVGSNFSLLQSGLSLCDLGFLIWSRPSTKAAMQSK